MNLYGVLLTRREKPEGGRPPREIILAAEHSTLAPKPGALLVVLLEVLVVLHHQVVDLVDSLLPAQMAVVSNSL